MGWTKEKVEELRSLWDKGLTANEIAKILGVTKNAIVGKVHRLCLKARPSPIKSKTEEHGATLNLPLEDAAEEVLPAPEENTPCEVKPEQTEVCRSGAERIRLVDLDSHTCRWPVGDPRDDDFGFCGKKVRAGQTYCDEHSSMAYVKATRK